MATTLQCDIVSAEAQIYSGAVELLVATGVEGELGVCFGHAALLTRLIPGPIRVVEHGGEEQVYYASGGFLEVQGDVVTVLADTAVRADDIDEAAAETARKPPPSLQRLPRSSPLCASSKTAPAALKHTTPPQNPLFLVFVCASSRLRLQTPRGCQ